MAPNLKRKPAEQKKKKRAEDDTYNSRERERRKRLKHEATRLMPLLPIPVSRINEILLECGERLSNTCLAQKCCCVCDCLHPVAEISCKRLGRSKQLLQAMQKRLKVPPLLCPELEAQYDLSSISPSFAGMLLSPRGILNDGHHITMQICKGCLDSLAKKSLRSAPKFAIANGLYIGVLPNPYADDLTMTENAMLNLAQPTRFMTVVQGGKHSAIRSHAYYFRAEPCPPAAMLPAEVISKGTIGVTMVGAMTALQKAKTLKRYQVRVPRLFAQLEWYRAHNRLYASIGVVDRSSVEEFVSSTDVVLDCTVNDDDGPQASSLLVDSLDESHLRHNEPAPAHIGVQTPEGETSEQSAVAIVTDFTLKDDIELTRQVLENADVVVRRSSGILSDFDPEFWIYCFCELFPFGRGGLNEMRAVPISLENYICYCLRLSTRCFCRHPSFSLVAFDVLARHHSTRAVYLRARLAPGIARSIANVNRDQLLQHLQYLEDRRNAIAARTTMPEQPIVEQPVRDLLSAVSTGLRAFFGSNQERGQARTRVMSMQLAFGQPSIFFTITPDCSAVYRVANLAGEMPDDLLTSHENTLKYCLDYTKAKLGAIATRNPVACAQYFNYIMDIIVTVVLNWDTKRNCSKSGTGLFGQTEAYFSSTESQGSTGNLHCHMLLWVRGMAKSVDEYYSACRSSAVRRKLVSYVESIAASSFPISTDLCPCCENTALISQPFRPEAFQRSTKSRERPTTAKCTNCSTSFGADELIRRQMDSYAVSMGVEHEEWSGPSVHHHVASPGPLPLPDPEKPLSTLVTCQALLQYQVHHWYHCKSCFKTTKRTPTGKVCRMFFPKEICNKTAWSADEKVLLRRETGSEYLNTYIPLVNSVFKCNHDVKFLTAAEGPEKAYYMMKYTTKDQNSVENPLAIHLHAYDKARLRVADCGNDAVAAGRRCVQSMCCSLSNAQEISAPLAALYIERGSPFYESVEFVNVHVWSWVDTIFNGAALNVVLSQHDQNVAFTASSLFMDYVYRPAQLADRTLMTFIQLYKKEKNLRGLHFVEPHAELGTHSLHERSTPAVANLLGKRLPDMRNPDVNVQEKEQFQRAMLVLFHPFRSIVDFHLGDNDTESQSFQQWWCSSAPVEASQFLSYSNDYYLSRERARQRADDDMERYMSYLGNNSDHSDDDDDIEILVPAENFGDEPLWDDTADLQLPIVYADTIDKAMLAASLAADSLELPTNETVANDPISVELLDESIARAEKALTESERPPMALNLHRVDSFFSTRVDLLATAIADADTWTDPKSLPAHQISSIVSNSSLVDVSRSFCLNEKQHKAFVRVGRPFLQSLLSTSPDNVPQCLFFLGGGPGTGKSQVIRALQVLAHSWASENAVKTVAYQGVAAEAANGQTIHKLFQWGVRKGVHNKRYAVADKERFASFKLLIMDEVSTTDAKYIGMIDIALRDLKNEPDKRFGGVHMLFAGDWLQQLPVAGHPAFVREPPPPTSRRSAQIPQNADDATTTYLLRQRGIQAYGEINDVVMLDVNMRHRNDPVWRDILSRWRLGDYQQGDIDLVNMHCSDKNWDSASSSGKKAFCPILVTSNALRVEFNALATVNFCKKTHKPLHIFPARVTRSRFDLTPAQLRSLTHIRSDKTGGLPMRMMLAVGMPMQCTKNISRALHLANGTIGTVVNFQGSAVDTIRVENNNDYETHYHSKPAEVVFLRVNEGSLRNKSLVDCVPAGTTIIRRRKEPGVAITIRDRSFSVTVDQIPLIPAFGLTTEKCQGLTVDKVVIGPLRHFTRRQPQRSSFYVAVTRVRTMLQMYLMEPLTLEFLSYFKPSEPALLETRRLCGIEEVRDRH